MRAIAAATSQVPPSAIPWENRLLLGCWNVRFPPHATIPLLPTTLKVLYPSEFVGETDHLSL